MHCYFSVITVIILFIFEFDLIFHRFCFHFSFSSSLSNFVACVFIFFIRFSALSKHTVK